MLLDIYDLFKDVVGKALFFVLLIFFGIIVMLILPIYSLFVIYEEAMAIKLDKRGLS